MSFKVYSEGIYTVVKGYERRRKQFIDGSGQIPNEDVDLNLIKSQIVARSEEITEEFSSRNLSFKASEFQNEFKGQSNLLFLHALVIAVLRRRKPPEKAVRLFQRMWKEQGEFLVEELNTRWKISAATTFAEHGSTFEQRSVGMGLSILFDSMKMHDSERRRTGQPGRVPFPRKPGTRMFPLPFGLAPYSLHDGDLDRNILARLWIQASEDETIFPLARSMLFEILSDQRSIFARVQKLRQRRQSD